MRRTRIDKGERKGTKYGYENLAIGESMLIGWVPGIDNETRAARVRKSVGGYHAAYDMRWTCSTKTTGVRVTRTK